MNKEISKNYYSGLITLYDVLKYNHKKLSKKQCKVIAECFLLLSKDDTIKEDVNLINSKLWESGINWLPSTASCLKCKGTGKEYELDRDSFCTNEFVCDKCGGTEKMNISSDIKFKHIDLNNISWKDIININYSFTFIPRYPKRNFVDILNTKEFGELTDKQKEIAIRLLNDIGYKDSNDINKLHEFSDYLSDVGDKLYGSES